MKRSGTRPRTGKRALFFVRDVIIIIVIAALVSWAVKTYLVRSFFIPSASMENTLQVDDRILVDELSANESALRRGDVIVFRDPGGWLRENTTSPTPIDHVLGFIGLAPADGNDHLIKRIIGLPGDHVICCDALGQLVINDTPIEEPYLADPSRPSSALAFDVTVPPGSLWVMGHDRNSSADSRAHQEQPTHGFVPIANVEGRAFLVTWPLDRIGWIDAHNDQFKQVSDPR